MAGSARYTAVLDACVLYPAPLRDVLLSLGRAGLYHARWTHQIHDEWMRNLLAQRPDLAEDKLRSTRELMNTAIPDSLIENYEVLIDKIQLPDPEDRHVVAAAIIGHADAIVTFNWQTLGLARRSEQNNSKRRAGACVCQLNAGPHRPPWPRIAQMPESHRRTRTISPSIPHSIPHP